MKKFVLIVEFLVKKECLDEFNRLIEINAHASVTNEPGCFQFDVCASTEDPTKVLLYEVYASDEAFQEHMKQSHTQTFLAAAKPLIHSQTATRWSREVAPKVKFS
jgi:quinol monooxygenase YgiN